MIDTSTRNFAIHAADSLGHSPAAPVKASVISSMTVLHGPDGGLMVFTTAREAGQLAASLSLKEAQLMIRDSKGHFRIADGAKELHATRIEEFRAGLKDPLPGIKPIATTDSLVTSYLTQRKLRR